MKSNNIAYTDKEFVRNAADYIMSDYAGDFKHYLAGVPEEWFYDEDGEFPSFWDKFVAKR